MRKGIKTKNVYGIVWDTMTIMPCVCVNEMLVHGYKCNDLRKGVLYKCTHV